MVKEQFFLWIISQKSIKEEKHTYDPKYTRRYQITLFLIFIWIDNFECQLKNSRGVWLSELIFLATLERTFSKIISLPKSIILEIFLVWCTLDRKKNTSSEKSKEFPYSFWNLWLRSFNNNSFKLKKWLNSSEKHRLKNGRTKGLFSWFNLRKYTTMILQQEVFYETMASGIWKGYRNGRNRKMMAQDWYAKKWISLFSFTANIRDQVDFYTLAKLKFI